VYSLSKRGFLTTCSEKRLEPALSNDIQKLIHAAVKDSETRLLSELQVRVHAAVEESEVRAQAREANLRSDLQEATAEILKVPFHYHQVTLLVSQSSHI
jgi:hypothetical protein